MSVLVFLTTDEKIKELICISVIYLDQVDHISGYNEV